MINIVISIVLLVCVCSQSFAAITPINPTTDLTYLGAFRLPSSTRSSISHWGVGTGMTFIPSGNSGNGSLAMVNGVESTGDHLACEFTIPSSFGTGSISGLPSATQIRGWTSIDGGKIASQANLDGNNADIGDICYMSAQGAQTSDKLYWSGYCYYNTNNGEYPALGLSELNMSGPQGMYKVGSSTHHNKVGGILFEANHAWADAHASGRYLINGRHRENGSYSAMGPPLFAIAPWEYGNPPSQGTTLSTTTLIDYCDSKDTCPENQQLTGASVKDRWRSGVWITAGDKQSILIGGMKGSTTNECYGDVPPCTDPCYSEDKGYHAYPYSNYLLWYNVDSIAGYSGLGSVQPYSTTLPTTFYADGESCASGFGGLAYQENYSGSNGRLFVAELAVDSGSPVIHVFSVTGSTESDTTPPTVTAFTIPSTSTSLTVNITTFTASDNVGVTGYKLTESATAPGSGDAGWTGTAPTTYTFSTEGSKTLYAWAKDAAGNVSTSLNDSVTITLPDTTAPSVTISTTDPSNITVDTLSISGSASDAVGVTACKWRIGSAPDGAHGTALSGTTSWSGTATGFSSGANTLYAGCTDAAGNWGSDSMVVNYTPPSSFRVGPVGGTLSGGTIQ